MSEEKSFEIVDGRRTDNGACLSISSPGAFGSGELKRYFEISVYELVRVDLILRRTWKLSAKNVLES